MTNDIYTYIETNFNIKVTDYQFKRDYILNPLKKIKNKYELPHKEDLEYLYITLNIRRENVAQLLGIQVGMLKKIIKSLSIKKDVQKVMDNVFSTIKDMYGVNTYPQYYKFTEQCLKTIQKNQEINSNYYVDIIKKRNETSIERYGVEHYMKLDVVKNNIKENNMIKYGVEHYFQSGDYQEKAKQSCLSKYGVTSYTKTNECQDKIKHTKQMLYGNPVFVNQEKAMKTNLEKYGEICYSKTNQYKKLYDDKEWVLMRQNKIYDTKRKNNTFNTSSQEKIIFEKLKTIYENIDNQYSSDLYPYKCDFYIPETNTYIEYNGHWTHGKEPYIGTDEQNEIIKLWESKNTPQYNVAINVWTKRDVLKRTIAKNNNLNYLEFFNMDEFNKWYDQQDKKGSK